MSRFDEVAAELKALGLTISMRPGEYCVKRPAGTDADGYLTDDLDDALAYGRAVAAESSRQEPVPVKRRSKPPRPMSARAMRRRFIRRHNYRQNGRARKERETG